MAGWLKSESGLFYRVSAQLFLISALIAIPLSVISGLVLAPIFIISGIPFLILYLKSKHAIIRTPNLLKIIFLLMIWSALSILWSINSEKSLILWLKNIPMFMIGIALIVASIEQKDSIKRKLENNIITGFFLALILIVFEIITNGVISRNFRELLTGNKDLPFKIEDMNRGVSFIVLMFWPLIYAIYKKTRRAGHIAALIIWGITFAMIYRLDSLASTIAFIASTMVFIFVYLTKGKLNFLITLVTVILMIGFPFAAGKINPEAMIQKYPNIPHSAEHRLYIWNFAAEKISKKTFLGYGLDSSRYVEGADKHIMKNNQEVLEWVYLPLHPHNSILQTILELGIPGAIIFVCFAAAVLTAAGNKRYTIEVQAAALALAVSYIVIGFISFGVWQQWWISAGFLSAAFMAALFHKSRQGHKSR